MHTKTRAIITHRLYIYYPGIWIFNYAHIFQKKLCQLNSSIHAGLIFNWMLYWYVYQLILQFCLDFNQSVFLHLFEMIILFAFKRWGLRRKRNSPLANILPHCGWYNEIRFSFFGRNMLQQDRQIRKKKDAPSQGCTALLTLVQN